MLPRPATIRWSSSSALIGALRPASARGEMGGRRNPARAAPGRAPRRADSRRAPSVRDEIERAEAARIVEREPPALLGLDQRDGRACRARSGSIRQRPDMPRWKISVSPRSVSISPYLARRPRPVTRAPVSRWRRSGGKARRRSARLRLDPDQPPAFQHRRRPRTVVSTSGSSGMAIAGEMAACTWRRLPLLEARRDGQGLFRSSRTVSPAGEDAAGRRRLLERRRAATI